MLHDRQEMTKSVICQAPTLEIDTKLVIRHSTVMPAQTKSRLSEHLRNEMTPARIGYRLMLFREALGLLPSEMADRLDIPRTYWSRFEGGKRAITDDVAAMLVERFGVTLDFLVLGRWDRLPMDLADKMRDVEARKNM
jgi:plasmid maintenance system antidote protein VapI